MKKVKFLLAFVLLAVVLVLDPKVYAYTTFLFMTNVLQILQKDFFPPKILKYVYIIDITKTIN